MAHTLEDLDRRVTALELAQSARSENAIVRIEQKVDALHRVTAELIAESEQRMRAETQRILTVVNAAEQRTAGLINDSEQRVLAALDRLKNP
jgi:hypothetical protein